MTREGLQRAWRRRLRSARARAGGLLRLWRLYLLRAEIRLAPSENQRLFLLTVGLGVLCGLAAVAFHATIRLAETHLIDRALAAPGRSWIVWTLAVPTLGGLVCGALLQYVVPNARGSGIPQVKAAFASDDPQVPLRDSIGKFAVGALQIGSGASLGREGPTVHICAGVAGVLGRLAGISAKSRRRLLPVGVAAGIAAAFNAPIAAVTFTIEEVVGNLDQAVLSGVIVAAAVAAVIERSLLGEAAVFNVPSTYSLGHASSLLVYAVLGVAAAVVSVAFTESLLGLRLAFRRLKSVPVWARPALGGTATGALAIVAVLVLGSHGVTGGGYEALSRMLRGEVAAPTMGGLCVLKLGATVASYSSGGAGGIFAPSLFIGGALGGAVGMLDGLVLGHGDVSLGAFAVVGMGAVFAGVIRAPITSVLIIVEMTGGYSLILPLMIANMSAYVLARRWRPVPIYEALLEQDGVHLRVPASHSSDGLPIGQLLDLRATLRPSFGPGAPASDIVRETNASHERHVLAVVDGERQLVGIIVPDDLHVVLTDPDLLPLVNATDLMRPAVSVGLDVDVRTAVETMLAHGIRELPVTDGQGHVLGFLDDATLARAYARRAP